MYSKVSIEVCVIPGMQTSWKRAVDDVMTQEWNFFLYYLICYNFLQLLTFSFPKLYSTPILPFRRVTDGWIAFKNAVP